MRWAKALNKANYNVLTFDLRNSGQSEGNMTSMGYYERNDVIGALDYLVNEKGIKEIGVLCASMGAAATIPTMVEDVRIKAAIFEATFSHLPDLWTQILDEHFSLPRYPLIPLIVFFFELRTGIDINDINQENYIGLISPRPIFLIHCPGENSFLMFMQSVTIKLQKNQKNYGHHHVMCMQKHGMLIQKRLKRGWLTFLRNIYIIKKGVLFWASF